MILTVVALLSSCFSSPALSAFAHILCFIIGHFSADLKGLANSGKHRRALAIQNSLPSAEPLESCFHHSGSSWTASQCCLRGRGDSLRLDLHRGNSGGRDVDL